MQVFKEWCTDEKNLLIIPGYCVPGTLGNKLLSGVKSLTIDGKLYDIKMKIRNMSFSAHADAKGIMQLVKHVEPKNVVFIHGDKVKEHSEISNLIEKDGSVERSHDRYLQASLLQSC